MTTTYDSNYAYTMATQLAQYDTQYSYARLDRNKTNYTQQQTALNSLSSALSTFQTKLSGLNSVSGSILQNKATLSSEGYATAEVTSKAQAGSYQFHVAQLASKDQYALQNLTASGTLKIGQPGNLKDDNSSKGSISINLADPAYQNADGLDLAKVADKINSEAKTLELGVNATLVRSGGTVNLVLSSEETGLAQRLEIDLGTTGATKTHLSAAQDAEAYLGPLPSQDRFALRTLSDASLVDGGGTALGGTLILTQGGANFDVDLAGVKTLSELAGKINAAADNTGVQASLVTTNGVTNLVLSSAQAGADQAISLAYAGDAALQAAFTGPSAKEVLSTASDGGIRLTNSSNTFNNIIDGVSLTFSKVHKDGDAPLTLDIAQDNEGTKAKVQEFVDAYNALAGELKKLTASGSEDSKRGALAGDGTVRSIKSMIDNIIRKGVTVDGQQISLVSLGISSTREGNLTLDSSRLEKTLATNPNVLETLFKGAGGDDKGILGALLNRETGLAKYTSSVNGILKNRKDSVTDSLKRIERERERVDTQYDNLYQRYLAQYTNLVSIMNQMSQTSSLYFT